MHEAISAHMSLGQASVTNMKSPTDYTSWHERVMAAIQSSSDPVRVATEIVVVAKQVQAEAMNAQLRAAVLFECSSWIINYGDDLQDAQLICSWFCQVGRVKRRPG
jgi:hypothetical protein